MATATKEQILKAFMLLLGAGLDYPPRPEEVATRIDAWTEMLAEHDGAAVIQAAKDYIKGGEKFPSIPRMIEQVKKVEYNHGRSVYENPSRERATPIWVQQEFDRLKKSIGHLCTKKFEDWDEDDYYHYERAISARHGSAEETQYWENLYGAAYHIPHMDTPPHPEFASWVEAMEWQEKQRGRTDYVPHNWQRSLHHHTGG
jgi:hypothetical protein